MNAQLSPVADPNAQQPHMRRPRLGFLGVGWIGRQRMQALADSNAARIVAIADADAHCARAAVHDIAGADVVADLDALLERDLDGMVIATPSGLHAAQAIAALERGLAVFCQKPLARTAAETQAVVAAAQRADRLLGVDFSYRAVAGVPELRALVRGGALGDIYAIDLTFHNAYGPDKPWFGDLAQAGGGCVMDLGIHLVDLARWVCGDDADIESVHAQLCAQARPLQRPVAELEDYASAQWRSRRGIAHRMACSWRLPAGRDAIIEAAFYGSHGGAALRNVDGSFYDFTVEHFDGTARQRLAGPPDTWGGRLLVQWAQRLAHGDCFDAEAWSLVEVARVVDGIYGR